MPDYFLSQRYEFEGHDADRSDGLRFALGQLAPALRAELWWWMAQRGRTEVDPMPADLAELDPGADVIVESIALESDPAYRKANWLLATYAVLTRFDHPHEARLASPRGTTSRAAFWAFLDIPVPEDWTATLMGGAVAALGLRVRSRVD